jgi:hypothetical protein
MKMLLVGGLASAAFVFAVFIAVGGHSSLDVRIALAGLYLILSAICATGAAATSQPCRKNDFDQRRDIRKPDAGFG